MSQRRRRRAVYLLQRSSAKARLGGFWRVGDYCGRPAIDSIGRIESFRFFAS